MATHSSLRTSLRWCVLIVVAAGLLDSPASAADDKDKEKKACLAAYESGQRLRQEDKLVAAREQLLVCAREVCPKMFKNDCVLWMSEVDQAMPSVVIDAKDPDGRDAFDVRVSVDGKPFADKADGKAVSIDPGVHMFKFEMEGAPLVEERVVIRLTEKNRRIKVSFKRDAASPGPNASATPTSTQTAEQPTEDRPVPTMVYVLGGVGVVSLGAFAYFALKFNGQVSDLDACKPNCQQSAVDDASSTRTISFIPLGVGVVSLGVATYLYFSRPAASASQPTTEGLRFDLRPVAGSGTMATFGGTF